MRLPALIHLLTAARSISQCDRIRVLGSSALLPSFPELGEPGQPLEVSYDADLLIEPSDENLAALLHEALGEGSLFSGRSGYHADILRPSITETLSPGWQDRLVKLDLPGDIAALSPEDVAVVKLQVGRPKDLTLCRHLIVREMLTVQQIRSRLDATPMPEADVIHTYRRLQSIS